MEMVENYQAGIIARETKATFIYDGTDIVLLDSTYPEILLAHNIEVQNYINAYYRNKDRQFMNYVANTVSDSAIADYKQAIANDYPFREYAADLKYTLTMNENCVLSLYYDQYQFTGGAHGSTTRTSDTWNLQTGAKIKMADLFARGASFRNIVIQQILRQADEIQNTDNIYFDNYRALIVRYFNVDSFYLTPTGMAVYYQQYEIGPYAIGIQVFEIPYEDLGIQKPTCAIRWQANRRY